MSKPSGSKQKPESARLPSNPPPNTRKTSGANGVRSSSKFYDGPTVPKSGAEVKEQAKVAADKTVKVVKSTKKQAVRVAKRHPWSIVSILTTIPLLIAASLFSTILCPATEPPSGISRFVHTRLGIHDGHSELRQTLCYPANRYHKEILQPYVYPIIDQARSKVESNTAYTYILGPGYTYSRTNGVKIYNKYVAPIVQPHLPWARTKWYTLTAPISDRVSAAHQQYLAPHISTAGRYSKSASDSAISGWRYAARHPFTALAQRHAQTGYRVGKQKGGEAYVWSRPHVLRLARKAEKLTREEVVPRVTAALKFVVDHLEDGFYVAKAQIASQYNTHLDPHLHPYTSKVTAFVAPYSKAFIQRIYTPYLQKYVHYFVPATLLAPEPPMSFWSMISDFLPSSPGSHAAEGKGRMTEKIRQAATTAKVGDKSKLAREQAAKASALAKEKASSASVVAAKSASSVASVASKSASRVSAAIKSQVTSASSAGKSVVEEVTKSVSSSASAVKESATAEKGKMTKAEFETARQNLAAQLEAQGKASMEKLKQELIGVQNRFLADTYPKMTDTNKLELTKDIDYILSGLDKLYSESEALTRDQVKQSGVMAEKRLSTKLATVRGRGGEVARVTKDQGKPFLKREMDAVDAVLGKEWTDLAMKIAWIEGITPKDRQKFNELRKSADEHKSRLESLHDGKLNDKPLQAAESKLSVAVKELSTELDDLFAGFKERVKILQKSANDKIGAREMLKGSQAAASAARSSAHTAKGDRATILPIIPGAVAADVPDVGIIGKGKEQVISALSQAGSATSGVAEQAASAYNAAASVVHGATRSASRAVGATPSPESPLEHVQSIRDAAQSVISSATESVKSINPQSAYSVASQSVSSVAGDGAHAATEAIRAALGNIHSATESIKSVSANEYLASVGTDVAASAASVYSVVEENVHQATRSIISAAGATPSPESPIEYAQSYGGEISKTAESLASVISASASSIASAASSAGSNAGVSLSSVVHEGTRSVIRAVGATPSPEGVQEHFEAYAAAAAETLGSLMEDVGANPVVSAASASASSVYSAAGAGQSEVVKKIKEVVGARVEL